MKRLQKAHDDTVRNPQAALIRWLNEAGDSKTFLTALVQDAKCVMDVLGRFKTLRAFVAAEREAKHPKDFWKVYARLNDTLHNFRHTPLIDANFYYEGEPVHWMSETDDPLIAQHSLDVRCLLELIRTDTLRRIDRCHYQGCRKWYGARITNQRFCTPKCRWKAFASEPTFKAERREYERKRYRLHVSGKVASKTGK